MALSRKHFREIARILGENLADDDLINEFVSFCASQNQYFQKQVFIDAIKKDITWLGFQWDSECYASDYFDQLYDWAVMLIKKGKAYVDSQSQEEISEQRGVPTSSGKNSPHRDREVIENLDLFENLKIYEKYYEI